MNRSNIHSVVVILCYSVVTLNVMETLHYCLYCWLFAFTTFYDLISQHRASRFSRNKRSNSIVLHQIFDTGYTEYSAAYELSILNVDHTKDHVYWLGFGYHLCIECQRRHGYPAWWATPWRPVMYMDAVHNTKVMYRKISNISCTKSPNLKCFSPRLVVVCAQANEARCSVENEDVVGAAPTGDAPTTSEWSTILLPTKVRLILETWR